MLILDRHAHQLDIVCTVCKWDACYDLATTLGWREMWATIVATHTSCKPARD